MKRRFTNPDTGQTLLVEGEGTPTEAEIAEMFRQAAGPGAQQAQQAQQEPQQAPQQSQQVTEEQVKTGVMDSLLGLGKGFLETAKGTVEQAVGTAEALGTLVSGAVAEIPAGLVGAGVAGVEGSEAGTEAIEAVREAGTFQPRTEAGQERLQQFGEVLKPVGEALVGAEKFLGDQVFDLTEGLPPEARATLSAGAATVPTAILEFIGVKGSKIARSRRAAKVTKRAEKLLPDAIPTVERLKAQSTAVFDQIDDLNATLKPEAYDALVRKIQRRLDQVEGITPGSQPNTTSSLNDMRRFVGGDEPLNLKRLENLRANAKENASAANVQGRARDASLSESIADDIDNWLEDAGTSVMNFPEGRPQNLGDAYKAARQSWGKAKSVEEVNEMVSRAELARAGFRPGLESQFASFLKNKKKTRFFKPEQLKVMDDFAKGKTGANDRLIHLLAGFSPTEGGTNRRTLLTLLQAGGGTLLGKPLAAITPALGFSAHLLSKQKATGVANYLRNIIAAGNDAGDIAEAYIRVFPKGKRTPEALGKILAERGADLDKLLNTDFQKRAAEVARDELRRLRSVTAVPGVAEQARQQAQPIGAQ